MVGCSCGVGTVFVLLISAICMLILIWKTLSSPTLGINNSNVYHHCSQQNITVTRTNHSYSPTSHHTVIMDRIDQSGGRKPMKTMFFLHGYSTNSAQFINYMKDCLFPLRRGIKMVFLSSTIQHLDSQTNRVVTPWFRTSIYDDFNYNLDDVYHQSRSVASIINAEIDFYTNLYRIDKTSAAKRVFLGGQSQGACLSFYVQVYNPYFYTLEMSITLVSILLKYLLPSLLYCWNICYPLYYVIEMAITLATILLRCL